MPRSVAPPASFLEEVLGIVRNAVVAFPFGDVSIGAFIASAIRDAPLRRRLAFSLLLCVFAWTVWTASGIGLEKLAAWIHRQYPRSHLSTGGTDFHVLVLMGYAYIAYCLLFCYRHAKRIRIVNPLVLHFSRSALLCNFAASLAKHFFILLVAAVVYYFAVWDYLVPRFPDYRVLIHLVAGITVAILLAYRMPGVRLGPPGVIDEEVIAGTGLSTHEKATEQALQAVARRQEPVIDFGTQQLPLSFSEKHFLLVGASGGGKSVYLLKLMKSVFAGSAQARALIYDGKNELVPSVMALCPGRKVIILNPLDARSVAWDIAADTTRFTDAQEIAKLLYPEGSFQGGGGDQGFFEKAGRNLLSSLFMTFNHLAPGDWTLRDVLAATRGFESRLLPILKTYRQENQALLESFANPEVLKMALSILTSLTEQLNKFRAVAAIWDRCPKDDRFSLDRWIREGQEIIVLGSTSRAREAAHAISSVFLERTFKLVLEKENNSQEDRTWFFLDEMREAPRLDGFGTFLSQARSKGGCVAMTFQSFAGFKVVYGDDSAQEVSGFPGNRMFFRCADTQTDTWVRNQFGRIRIRRTRQSVSETEGENPSTSTSQNSEDSEQDVLIEGYLLNMPPASREKGFHSLNVISGLGKDGAYSCAMPFQETINSLPPKSKDPEQLLRPAAHEEFRDWTEADLKRLNLQRVVSLEVLKDDQPVPSPAPTRPPDDDNPDDMGVLAGL